MKQKVLITLAFAVLALLWLNARIIILRKNQDPAKPTVLSSYPVFHGMAMALEEGRVGQFDLAAYYRHVALQDPAAPFPKHSAENPPQFVDCYSYDIGYSFIVEVARRSFPTLPDNYMRSLALQLLTDMGLVVFLYVLFSEWHIGAGLLASFLYVGNKVFGQLVSVPFYYYWDVPITFAALGMLAFALRRPLKAVAWLTLLGLLLGFGVWLRASWWPISFFLLALVLLTPALRAKAAPAVIVFVLLAAPQAIRSSLARGHFALSTRASWHVALVGLGYYPNAYGLQAKDEAVLRLTREKYGIVFHPQDYGPQDEAARGEYVSILRKDPAFVVGSFLGRLKESLLGVTETNMREPFPFLPTRAYRALCVAGLALMIRRGGERRFLAWAAAGTYLTYVSLTSLFYFVGGAYDNVSQACLFLLLIGFFEALARGAIGTFGRWAAVRRGPGASQAEDSG
jgi:hypothetical protein